MLNNKVAIVTGGSRGIGLAIARAFAANGAALLLVARDAARLSRAQVELASARVEIESGDLGDPSFPDRIVRHALDAYGTVDILVNCAGTITRTPLRDLSLEEWRRVIDVNLTGAFLLSQRVLPVMCGNGSGKIINITSQMARIPHPGASPSYEVSKAGLAALTRHLAYHYAPYGICVNSIAPGSIDTDLPKNMPPKQRAQLKATVPLGRLGDAAEVAALALFLASDQSNYITGATVNISGGSLMD